MSTTIGRPRLEGPSFGNIAVFASTVLWFGCMLLVLNGNSDLSGNSVFIAFVSSLLFLLSAEALVQGVNHFRS
jgi:hypothetical protein